MICSNCGAENPTGLKFCEQCAAPFKKRCARCGFENSAAARFCGECAAPLSAAAPGLAPQPGTTPSVQLLPKEADAPAPEGERKTVTALFVGITGPMQLYYPDLEKASAIVVPAFELMRDAVHRYNGCIAHVLGDDFLALFGAPIAHEDHAQRALYAAFRMQEEMKRYSDRIRAEGRIAPQVRIGANTGEVVVRSIKTDETHTEYTPIGHSVINLATRIQVLAPAGSIAATEQVRKLCEGYFVFKGLGQIIKQVTGPVNVYEVTGLGPLGRRL